MLILQAIIFSVSAFADGPPDRIVIHLLDPRGAIAGDQAMPIEWGDGKADLIATRRLNTAEARKLQALLLKELADDDDVPFCGHRPVYAVTTTFNGNSTTTVTLCGACGTWARGGDLRALHGKDSLKFLDKLLPLPEVFRTVDGKPAKLLDPFYDGANKPFHLLDDTDGG